MEKSIKLSTFFLAIITIVVVSAVFKYASAIFLPIVMAILLSYVFSPIVELFEKIKIPRIVAIFLVMLLFAGIIVLLGQFLYMSIVSFGSKFDKYQQTFLSLYESLTKSMAGLMERFNMNSKSIESYSLSKVLNSINWTQQISNIAGKFATLASDFGVVIMFLIFILIEKPLMRKKLFQIYKGDKREKMMGLFQNVNSQIVKYLSLKFFVSLLTGILAFILLSIIGLDFAGLWGFLAFLLNFIPSIGSLFVILITVLMGLVQFAPTGEWGRFTAVAVSIIGTQVAIGNFLDPRLQGQRLNLSPVIILASLFFWGWIWGIVGMFLAVPLTVVIKIFMENVPGLESVGIMMGSGFTPRKDSALKGKYQKGKTRISGAGKKFGSSLTSKFFHKKNGDDITYEADSEENKAIQAKTDDIPADESEKENSDRNENNK